MLLIVCTCTCTGINPRLDHYIHCGGKVFTKQEKGESFTEFESTEFVAGYATKVLEFTMNIVVLFQRGL